ncbi:MAG: RteC domain-containing protein [Ginsengibacter sp.]
MIYIYQKTLNASRDKDYAKQVQKAIHECVNGQTFDDFSLEVAIGFNLQYKMGVDIKEILKGLREAQTQYLKNTKDPDIGDMIKNDYFKIFGINTNYIKSTTYFNKDGTEKSKYEYDYNYTFKNIKKMIRAKTEQEKLDIYLNEIRTKEQTIVPQLEITTQIIDVNEQDDRKWFKALVRYQTRKEFSEFLDKGDHEAINEKTKKKLVDPEKTKKIVTWTNGNNTNDFVKLIYTLHEAKLINKGNGEITKIVESLAPVFGIELKDWQSNFSKGIHAQRLDYNHGAFFENLKKTYVVEEIGRMSNFLRNCV